MMRRHTPSKDSVLRRGLVVAAAVLMMAVFGGLTTACGSSDQKEEFLTYWNAMGEVSDKHVAESKKAQKKADRTEGALNAYAAYYEALGRAYKQAASRFAAVEPPARLAPDHEALISDWRRSARAMNKVAAEVNAEIADTGLTVLGDNWLDRVSKPGERAIKRAGAAFDRWLAAAKAEGAQLGIEFSGE